MQYQQRFLNYEDKHDSYNIIIDWDVKLQEYFGEATQLVILHKSHYTQILYERQNTKYYKGLLFLMCNNCQL